MNTLVLLLLLCCLLGVIAAVPFQRIETDDSDDEIASFEFLDSVKPIIVEGDIEIDPRRNARTSHAWPNGSIPYVLHPSYSWSTAKRIRGAMRQIESDVNSVNHTCIAFTPRKNEKNYINITPVINRCYSQIGMAGNGAQTVSLGRNCVHKGTIMHELMHAIGFYHEHTRTDRDNYVNIDFSNIRKNEVHNYVIRNNTDNLGTAYDVSSIMQYHAYEWAADSSRPVMTPKRAEDQVKWMGQRLGLSPTDVLKIQTMYKCPVDTSHINQPLQQGLHSCFFENTICDFINDTTNGIHWVFRTGSSAFGPKAGRTNGADAYLLAEGAPDDNGKIAKLTTPLMSNGSVCVEMDVYVEGESYLNVVLDGPTIHRQAIYNYKDVRYHSWRHLYVYAGGLKAGVVFSLTFEAHMLTGDVGLDDVVMYQGSCV